MEALQYRVTRRTVAAPAAASKKTAYVAHQKPTAAPVDGEGHLPTSLWNAVEYKVEGKEQDPAVLAAFKFVQSVCTIPDSIEGASHGPLAGMTYERRVVRAYQNGELPAKAGVKELPKLCTTCGDSGHRGRDCPKGF